MPEFIDDSLTGIVNRLIDERAKFLRHYEGQVMSVNPDMSILVDSAEFGTQTIDPSTWVNCVPGNNNKSQIIPDIGDTVFFYWPSGDGSRAPQYRCFSSAYETQYGSLTKNILYYANFGLTQISESNGALTFQAGLAKIVVDPITSTIQLSVGTTTLKVTSTGIFAGQIELFSHKHPFNDTGLGAVGASITDPPV